MTTPMSLDHLRQLLHAEHDLATEWEAALVDVARQGRAALHASRACVALCEAGSWRVFVDSGQDLSGEAVRLVASVSVLDAVHAKAEVMRIQVEQTPLSQKASVQELAIHSVLAVPLKRHGNGRGAQRGPLLGVLYLDRRAELSPFSVEDEAWARDFAALTERLLSLTALLNQAVRERDAARMESSELRAQIAGGPPIDPTESRDPLFRERIGAVLARAATADRIRLLLIGPSGVGKTYLARRFHELSKRRQGPFVLFDCGQQASSEALAAELFGFAKRSGFVGSPLEGRPGKAQLADGGVLFLDEINALPLELQQRLLRLVETGRYSALGSGQEVAVDVQIIAAANEDLRQLISQKRFREDLYFRLDELSITLPSLSERSADVLPFAERFLSAARRRFGRARALHFSAEAMAVLEQFPWSRAGNLRGLEHAVHRTVMMLPDSSERIERDQLFLPELLLEPAAASTLSQSAASAPRPSKAGDALRQLLLGKIGEHAGVLARIAGDSEVCAAFGVGERSVPTSSLRQRLLRLGLEDQLAGERARHDASLEQVLAAVRKHGNGRDAARALGISRDQLVARLRVAGLSIRKVLESGE